MRKPAILLLAATLLISTFSTTLHSKPERVKASYTIKMINPDRMLFGIVGDFNFPARMDSVVFKIEDTDNHYTEGYGQFVKQVEVYDSDSNMVPITKKGNNKWIVKEVSGEYKFTYIIPMQHLRKPSKYGVDETPFYIDESGVLIGSAMIIYPDLKPEIAPQNIEVDFVLGNNMQAVLPERPVGDNKFVIPSYQYIFNAYWAVGNYDTLTIGSENIPLRIGMERDFTVGAKDQILGNLRKLWSELTAIFGTSPEFDPVLLISRFPMSTKSNAVYNEGAGSPGSVNILLDAKLSPDQLDAQLGLFIYNLFSQWIPISFFPENRVEESWLVRGTANYYQLLLMRRVGVLNDDQFLNQLAGAYEQYVRDFDQRGFSVRAAKDIPGTEGYVYQAEMLTSCMLDLRLRAMSARPSSLDQVLAALAKRYHGNKNTFTNIQLYEMIDTLSGQYLMPFVDTCMNLPEKIDLPGMLTKFGITLENDPKGKPDLGAQFRSYTDLTLAAVQRRGGAHEAGLQEGDLITKVDGQDFNNVNALADYLASKKKAGDEIKVEYSRAGKVATTELKLGGINAYRAVKMKNPNKTQVMLWEKLVAPIGE